MSDNVLISNFSEISSSDIEGFDDILITCEDLLNQKVVSENLEFIKKMIDTFSNFESKYWSIYFDNESINVEIGENKIIEISKGYLWLLLDPLALKEGDYKKLIKNIKDEQFDIYSENFDSLIKVYLASAITSYEHETLLTSFNIAISKIFGETYTDPEIKSDEEILTFFGISIEEDIVDEEVYEKEIPLVDEKIKKLLSGETDTIEYKNSITDPKMGPSFLGSLMYDQSIKAIAGFANSNTGGSLAIGVHDEWVDESTELHSVNPNFIKRVNKQFKSEDDFLIKFGNALKVNFGKVFLASVKIEFIKLIQSEKEVKFLHIFVPAYVEPIFINFTNKDPDENKYGIDTKLFFVRYSYNSTEKLDVEEAIQYISQRFPNYIEALKQ